MKSSETLSALVEGLITEDEALEQAMVDDLDELYAEAEDEDEDQPRSRRREHATGHAARL